MNFLAFIFSFFVGDASINGYPFGSILLLLPFLLIKTFQIKKKDFLNLFILLIFLLLNIYKEFDIRYIFWPVNAFLLSLVIRSINIRAFSKSFMSIFILIWFMLNLINSNFGETRFDFIFGSNVQYRIFTVFFILFLINYSQKLDFKSLLSLLISIVGGLLTGSRGFLPLLALSNIKFAIDRNFYGKKGIFFMIFILIFCISFFDLIFYEISSSRQFFFSIENSSLSSRYMLLNQFLTEPLSLISLIGIDELNRSYIFFTGFPYPHNFVLELFIYYGFLGFFLSILFILNNIPKWKSEYFPLLIAACIWSLFSGDFGDNYVIFALLVAASSHKRREIWN